MKPINGHSILVGYVICTSLWLTGCSGTASSEPSTSGPAPASQASPGSSTGASFSAIVDGTKFSSNTGTDNLNAAFVINDNGNKRLFFMLADPDNPVQKLNFDLPYKEGSSTITILPKFSFEGYVTKDWIVYVDDGLTVNITTLGSTRVSGTFSGTYRLENEKMPNAKVTLQVTDGKFDIPFSTSAQWKKMYHAE